MKGRWSLLLALPAGSIAVGGFHPFEYWWAPLVSLILTLSLLRERGFRGRLVGFYLYGLGFLLPLLQWSSIYVGAFPWLLLCFAFATFFMILAFGFHNGEVSLLRFPLAYLLAEGLRAIVPFGGFGWGRTGFSQLDGPYADWLRIGGVSLTGSIVALSAAIIVKGFRFWPLLVPLILIGVFSATPATALNPSKEIRVGLIQGGVSQLGLDFNATPREVLNRHLIESRRLLERNKVDLILWPENASDIDPIKDPQVWGEVKAVVSAFATPVVIGAVTQSPEGPQNVSILVDEGGVVPSIYQKRDLVPFGEYIPLRNVSRKFSALVDEVKDFVPGERVVVHDIASLKFAPLICYEVLDDRIVRENLLRSNVGVVQTNNATFGRSWQSGQQFQMTRVRAFEFQVPFVVAATTGDTAQIDANGEVSLHIEKYRQSHMVARLSPTNPIPPKVPSELSLTCAGLLLSLSYIAASLRRRATR